MRTSPQRPLKIVPSLLAADFSRLAEEIRRVEDAGADALHVDVMDGHFVTNLTLGPVVVEWIRPHTDLPLDVHLMITDPAKFVEPFAKAGADRIDFHVELPDCGMSLVDRVRALGVEPGIALSPDSPVELLRPFYKVVAGMIVMSVYPGFGGQEYLPASTDRIKRAASEALAANPLVDIEVDGGINPETIIGAARAGANMIVAGTAIFRASDPADAIAGLRRAATEGVRRRLEEEAG